MLLKAEQLDKIGREIHLREMRCGNCKGGALNVDPRLFEIRQVSPTLGSISASSAEGLTLVVVECEGCQRVHLFDAGALGIS